MISVNEALEHLFALVSPLGVEHVPLRRAAGRRLAHPLIAKRTQPPFDASSMDGYAVKAAEVEKDALFKVIGEAAAGHGFDGTLKAGQAVRIFTGAPIPDGADFVVIQEDVDRRGNLITITADKIDRSNIRPAGGDFYTGDKFQPQQALSPRDIALAAAMNHAVIPVRRKPVIAFIPTGDELVQPGETPGPDQIIASNSYGLAAFVEQRGAIARLIPAARDSKSSLRAAFSMTGGADLIVTIGGASVGDHDLVAQVAEDQGLEQSFYKIAMRPGKPLMAGRIGGTPMVGLPGNPVSAMVCGAVFLGPMIDVMLGLPPAPAQRFSAVLAHDMGPNGPREHYMRAVQKDGSVTVFERQDSSLLHILSTANCLAIRPPSDPARRHGDRIECLPL